jgi:choline dehydrogenase-like flavoprotein
VVSGSARPADAVDAVIVGAGAAGSLFAARLARAGRKVVVLEAGPAWELSDLSSSQIWARRLKWGGPPVVHAAGQPSFPHNLNTGWGLGGAALHHYATWPRLPEAAHAMRSRFGRGVDWPFGADVLAPWYDRVQADVGVAGDAAAEPWRPPGAPYPLKPLRAFAQGQQLRRGFEALGLPLAPLPAAILTEPYKDRAPCQYDGWCDAGCPIGALANPLVTHLAEARRAGADIRTRATVLRILPDGRGRAGGVAWADAAGTVHAQRASVVVLATSAIQTPRLLLASAAPEWPAGAGNGRGRVGRGLMVEAVAQAAGLFDRPMDNHLGVSAGQLMHRAVPGDGRDRPFGGYQWQVGPSLKPSDIFGIAATRPMLFGQALHGFIADASRTLATMVGMAEQLPDPANRIELDSRRDRFGVPLARIVHAHDRETLALQRHVADEGERIVKAAGAREAWGTVLGGGHPAGGTPMGLDPATSVTDPFGRVHGIRNLFVTGSGLFPVTGGTSPTFTLMALADRAAAELLAHWSDHL